MFYIEACRLAEDPAGYTLENAHDQVQAIRLMHYVEVDKEDIRDFVRKCRTFEHAHSYLRQLAKRQMNAVSY